MNVFWVIVIVVASMFAALVLFSACRVGGQADDLTERMTGRRMS